MAIGSFVLVLPFELTFYIGMGIIIVGNGFFKPNISTMVGQLYKRGDSRRDAGFSLFYSGINFGAFFGGLICGWIGETISWHLGFGVAGMFMLIGLAVFFRGQHVLGPIGLPPRPEELRAYSIGKISKEQLIYIASILMIPLYVLLLINHRIVDYIMIPLTPLALIFIIYLGLKEGKEVFQKIAAALILIVFSMLFWAFYEQGGGSLNLFADRHVDMRVNDKESSTKLMAAAFPGDTIIQLESLASFSKGDNFRIVSSTGEENKLQIKKTLDNNSVILSEPLKFQWDVGAEAKGITQLSAASVNNAINPFYIILFSPLIGLLWIWLGKRKWEPNSAVKFALGMLLLGAGFFIFSLGRDMHSYDQRIPLWLFALGYFVITMGELCLSPIGLSMVTKLSPEKMVGLMMGMWFLASAFGQYLAGWIGALINSEGEGGGVKDPASSLFSFNDAFIQIGTIALLSGVVLLALSPILKKFMRGAG